MSTKIVDVKTPLENENKIENKNKDEEEGTIEKTNKYYLKRNTLEELDSEKETNEIGKKMSEVKMEKDWQKKIEDLKKQNIYNREMKDEVITQPRDESNKQTPSATC